MNRTLPAVFTVLTLVPVALAASGPDRPAAPASPAPAAAAAAAADPAAADMVPTADTLYKALPPLPALPTGKSTVIGGLIGAIDPVQDILTLDVYGGHAMKIFFDDRTHFYRDGRQTPISTMRAEERASVETVLDGSNVYALSVHMLTQTPQGECQGQVLSYDSGRGILTVRNSLSGTPIHLLVAGNTAISRQGQATFMSHGEGLSDLRRGALVSIRFEPDNQGGGVADRISILATPGAAFEFTGRVTYLDMHTAEMALLDPLDGNNYTIYFNPALFPETRNLHEGSNVRVTANFDGQRYLASSISLQ